MCGIVGLIGGTVLPAVQSQVLKSLGHRGPDASGAFSNEDGKVWLGHTRLSILDLSTAANQPFHSASGRYVMVYNGEVYNYRELANAYAIPTRTSSDTEVILELFVRKGPEFITELNGMFAIAIYDLHTKALHLFRDRLGIKPLYLYTGEDSITFASELPALKALLPDAKINDEAVHQFLHRGYIPEPLTLYRSISKFPAGTCAVIEQGKIHYSTYWKADDQIIALTHNNEKAVTDHLHELLRDSVRLRLVADVPFGTFLSGGADSGLITAIASEIHTQPIDTFNVSFEDAAFDETAYAKEMAEILGARHHNILITRKEVMDGFEEGLALVGEPFADSSLFPTMAISRFAAAHVKMALSGDGGDELFMGYGAYTWANRMHKAPVWAGRKLIAAALRARGGNRNLRAANVFDAPAKAHLAAHIFSQEQNFFTAKEIVQMGGKAWTDPYRPAALARDLRYDEAQAFFDLTNYLKDDLLVKVDRASMRYGLEVRVPFLDHRLVEYALNIDPALKTKGGEPKYLIKKMMERYYPNHLIYRQKWGFSIPLEKWMGTIDAPDNANKEKFVDTTARLSDQYSNGESHLYSRLYALMVLSRYI